MPTRRCFSESTRAARCAGACRIVPYAGSSRHGVRLSVSRVGCPGTRCVSARRSHSPSLVLGSSRCNGPAAGSRRPCRHAMHAVSSPLDVRPAFVDTLWLGAGGVYDAENERPIPAGVPAADHPIDGGARPAG